jgi:hypothetical protein
MKAICRSCREVGPSAESPQESKAAVEALGWHHTHRGGFLCPDCYFDDLGRRFDVAFKWGLGLAITAASFHVIALLLFLAHLAFEA